MVFYDFYWLCVLNTVFKYLVVIGMCLLVFSCGGGDSAPNRDEQVALSRTILLDIELREILEENGITGDPAALKTFPDISEELPQLGKQLFFSKILSGDDSVACASCHHPLLAGADGLSLPVGVNAVNEDIIGPGREHRGDLSVDAKADGGPNVPRNSQTIFNAALYEEQVFFDGRVRVHGFDTFSPDGEFPAIVTPESVPSGQPDINAGTSLLAAQAKFPVVSLDEMRGFHFLPGKTPDEVREFLAAKIGNYGEAEGLYNFNRWEEAFQQVFGENQSDITSLISYRNIALALAEYQRSQIFVDNPWKDFVQGNSLAISSEAKLGAILFYSPIQEGGAGCASCHRGDFFTDEAFHNLAVPQFGRGKSETSDTGRHLVTRVEEDKYKFRTPSLLNVNETGPWFHTGAYDSLEEVIRHHGDPVSAIAAFDFSLEQLPQFASLGMSYAFAEAETNIALEALMIEKLSGDSQLNDLDLSDLEVSQLVAFLKTLTDPCITSEICLQPWLPESRNLGPTKLALFAEFPGHDMDGRHSLTEGETPEPEPEPIPEILDQGDTSLLASLCFNGLTTAANDIGTAFTEVSVEEGLIYAHKLSGPQWTSNNFEDLMHTAGVAVADYDNDCWQDLFVVAGNVGGNLMFRNQLGTNFTNVTGALLLADTDIVSGPAFADINSDYLPDLILGKIQSTVRDNLYSISLWRNEGAIGFTNLSNEYGLVSNGNTFGSAFGDYNLDGYIDIYLAHWQQSGGAGEDTHLWKNNLNQGFTSADAEAGIAGDFQGQDFSFSPAFADIDNDGWQDILVAADFGRSQVYLGSGETEPVFSGNNTNISDENGMGSAVGDIDNDGDLDWFVSSIWDPNGVSEGSWGTSGNRLYQNDGAGNFTDITIASGVQKGFWGWGSCMMDFNNDLFLDIFHVNGWGGEIDSSIPEGLGINLDVANEFKATKSRMFLSNGDKTFIEVANSFGINDTGQGRGVSCFDYDRDGDVDIFVNNHGQKPQLYRNNLRSDPANNRFINIRLVGFVPNTQALGARIYVTAGGQEQMREVMINSNHLSHNSLDQHFGLAGENTIERIEVVWPKDLAVANTVLTNVEADQFIILLHPWLNASSGIDTDTAVANALAYFEEVTLEPAGILAVDRLNDWFDLPGFDDLMSEYDNQMALTSGAEKVKLEIYRRIGVNSNVVSVNDFLVLGGTDLITMPALYCDFIPLPADYLQRLSSGVLAGGYDATHVLLAWHWLVDNDCQNKISGLDTALLASAMTTIADIINVVDGLSDLEVEAIAFLAMAQRFDLIKGEWLTEIVNNQNGDGGWGDPVGSTPSNQHTSNLALQFILHLKHFNEPRQRFIAQ